MPDKITHIRFFLPRLWAHRVAMLPGRWLEGILAVCRNDALTFLAYVATVGHICLIKKGIAAFPPFTHKDEWASAAFV
jgi:hypothetical protein